MKNQWLLRNQVKTIRENPNTYYNGRYVFGETALKISGEDVLYVSNANVYEGIRLHLRKGGYLDLMGTPDEIADAIHELFMRGSNAS